jgi:hypothetical protein
LYYPYPAVVFVVRVRGHVVG